MTNTAELTGPPVQLGDRRRQCASKGCGMKLPIGYLSPRGWCSHCEYTNHINMRDAVQKMRVASMIVWGTEHITTGFAGAVEELIAMLKKEVEGDFKSIQ
jgi:hypothetical protein